MTRRRDPYAAVGAATREAIERAMPGLTLPEARVLLVLVSRLTSWSVLSERVAMRQIAEATGMDDRAVRRAVSSLAGRGVIIRSVGGSAPSEGRVASRFELPTPGQVTPGSTDPGSGDPGLDEAATPGRGDPQTPGRGDHLHENYARTVRETTPQPPAERGATSHPPAEGEPHPNCRQCSTNRRGARPVEPDQEPLPSPWAGLEAETLARVTELRTVDPIPPDVVAETFAAARQHLPRGQPA